MGAAESEIYRDLIRFRPSELSLNAWAVKAGVSRTVWADMRRHGNPSRRTLEKLLDAAGSSLAEFEALRVGSPSALAAGAATGRLAEPHVGAWTEASAAKLPLLATTLAGEWGDPQLRIELTELRRDRLVDRLERPSSLQGDPDAYAITMGGDAMWPRFRPGRRLAVSPRAPVAIGDDVLVQLGPAKAGGAAILGLVKELVAQTGSHVELRQFHPDVTFRIPRSDIAAVHKVMGEIF